MKLKVLNSKYFIIIQNTYKVNNKYLRKDNFSYPIYFYFLPQSIYNRFAIWIIYDLLFKIGINNNR